MWPNSQKTVDLVTFTEEICNGKLHFLCSDSLVLYYTQFSNNPYKKLWISKAANAKSDTHVFKKTKSCWQHARFCALSN